MSAGTYADPARVIATINGSGVAAVTLNQYLALWGPAPFDCRITGIQADARTVGTAAGNTVLDVLINGTSIWTTAGNRPTLAFGSTGAFALVAPAARVIHKGDRVDIQVATIPNTTGHALVRCTISLERTQ